MVQLWSIKREACRKAQRNKDDGLLRDTAKSASKAFEKAANEEKERLYEDFSRTVSEDRSLHKFWQLHKGMNGNKAHSEIPDFLLKRGRYMGEDARRKGICIP